MFPLFRKLPTKWRISLSYPSKSTDIPVIMNESNDIHLQLQLKQRLFSLQLRLYESDWYDWREEAAAERGDLFMINFQIFHLFDLDII